jgi:hypothetical protein
MLGIVVTPLALAGRGAHRMLGGEPSDRRDSREYDLDYGVLRREKAMVIALQTSPRVFHFSQTGREIGVDP